MKKINLTYIILLMILIISLTSCAEVKMGYNAEMGVRFALAVVVIITLVVLILRSKNDEK